MTLRQCFKAFLTNAELKNGIVNTESLDFEWYRKIIPAKLVPEGVDSELLWQIVFVRLVSVHDYKTPDRAWTDEEKRKAVDKLCDFFEGAPYKYDFYFRLPSTYPLGEQELTSNIQILIPDQKRLDTLEELNPPSGLDKIIGKTSQQENYKLPKVGEKYLMIRDKGMVVSGTHAYLEAQYSPDRLTGIFLALHVVYGTADTSSYKNEPMNPIVYDDKQVYRANFVSPAKEASAVSIKFEAMEDDIRNVNELFPILLSRNSDSALEGSRVQLTNSLYWYIQYLNTSEPSLRIVFLVSALDSLFPYRKDKITVPTAKEKIPVIAELVSDNEKERQELLKTLEKLFNTRNGVIHGSTEIHGYNRLKRQEIIDISGLADVSEDVYKKFIKTKLQKYFASIDV